jgi:hypothetical protein
MGKPRKNEDRQRRKAAERAASQRNERRTSWVARGIVVVLVVAAVAMSYSFYDKSRRLKPVKTTTYSAGMHADGPITYTENPPMGGSHNVVWQNCGIYDAPIHNEHAVHSMEHGAVWITYRPDLASDQVQLLKTIAADDFMLLSPYPGLGSAIVASAWNHQMAFARADDPALPLFVSEYKNNPDTTPEFGAACAGGTSALATADSLTRGAAPMRP